MGATNFEIKRRGKTLTNAYNDAVADAIYESGHDSYNGTISTTNGIVDKTASFKRSGLTLEAYIEKYEDAGGKWETAYGVCIKEPKNASNKKKSIPIEDQGEYVIWGLAAE